MEEELKYELHPPGVHDVVCPSRYFRVSSRRGVIGSHRRGSGLSTGFEGGEGWLLDIYPLAGDHVVDLFCDLTGMVPAALQVPGDEDVVGADGDPRRIRGHGGDALVEG